MRFLCIDYGDKIIGLAISDPDGIMAHGRGVLERTSLESDFEQLREIIRTEAVERIVVGLPIRLDSTIGDKANEVLAFVEELKKHTDIPIVTWDERLTSVEAEQSIKGMKLSRAQKKRRINTIAACIILQAYLDTQRPSSAQ